MNKAIDEKVTEDLNRVKKKLLERQAAISSSDLLQEEQVGEKVSNLLLEKQGSDPLSEELSDLLLTPSCTLRPQISSSSMYTGDSGITSRSLSSSSLEPPEFPRNFAPSEAVIVENNEQPLSPIINVDEPTSDTSDEIEASRKHSSSESSCHLNIPFSTRKGSTDSTTSASDKYETPPTISRSISVSSSASSSSTPQEVRIKVDINLPNSNEAMTVKMSAMVHKEQLQLNVSFTPTSLFTGAKIRRCCSPPSPKHKKKLKVPSKSFDEKSQKCATRSVKGMASKSFDEVPNSPTILPMFTGEGSISSSPTEVDNPPNLSKRSFLLPGSPLANKSSRHLKNQLIASIIQRNMVQFVDSTNIDTLCPHLFAKQLLSSKDVEELNAIKSVRGRNNFLYMLLLPNKGVNAYQKLFRCLREETHHCGHIDLVKIIDSGLKANKICVMP